MTVSPLARGPFDCVPANGASITLHAHQAPDRVNKPLGEQGHAGKYWGRTKKNRARVMAYLNIGIFVPTTFNFPAYQTSVFIMLMVRCSRKLLATGSVRYDRS